MPDTVSAASRGAHWSSGRVRWEATGVLLSRGERDSHSGGLPQSWSNRPREGHAAATSGIDHGSSDGLDREALFASFQPLVRRLIRQYGEDAELRQDLAGEIYCRFCTLLDLFDPARGIPLRAYLVRTLTASVYTFTRSHWRRQHREVSLDSGLKVLESAQSYDPSRQWDRDLVTEEVLRHLPEAIGKLPLRQRKVVIWRYYEARTFEEIAATLHVRPATARSLLRHGLNNLRRQIMTSGLAG